MGENERTREDFKAKLSKTLNCIHIKKKKILRYYCIKFFSSNDSQSNILHFQSIFKLVNILLYEYYSNYKYFLIFVISTVINNYLNFNRFKYEICLAL